MWTHKRTHRGFKAFNRREVEKVYSRKVYQLHGLILKLLTHEKKVFKKSFKDTKHWPTKQEAWVFPRIEQSVHMEKKWAEQTDLGVLDLRVGHRWGHQLEGCHESSGVALHLSGDLDLTGSHRGRLSLSLSHSLSLSLSLSTRVCLLRLSCRSFFQQISD